MRVTRLKTSVTRLIPDRSLVVRISPSGVDLRGYKKHRGRFFTWSQIASLSGLERPIRRVAETNAGKAELVKLGAKGE